MTQMLLPGKYSHSLNADNLEIIMSQMSCLEMKIYPTGSDGAVSANTGETLIT